MWTGKEAFTREAYLRAAALAQPGEKIPIYVLLATESENGVWPVPISEDDIAWGKQVAERLARTPFVNTNPSIDTLQSPDSLSHGV